MLVKDLRGFAVFIFMMLLILSGCSDRPLKQPITVTVLFSTDTRGNIFPCGCRVPLGGIAERAYEIGYQRTSSRYVLLLDNGNTLWGVNSLVESSHGEILAEAMNEMGYDVMNFRSSDLAYYREPELKKLLEEFDCDIISANLNLKDSEIKFKPYSIREVGGVKFGIIGVSEAFKYEQGRYLYKKPEHVLKDLVPEVRRKADIVIVLSGVDYRYSSNLAHMVEGIDVIISPPPLRPVLGSIMVKDTIIVTTIKDGKSLGVLELGINVDKTISDHKFKMKNIHEDMPKDKTVLEIIKKFQMNEE